MDRDTIRIILDAEHRAFLKGMEVGFDGGREHERRVLSHRMKNRKAAKVEDQAPLPTWSCTWSPEKGYAATELSPGWEGEHAQWGIYCSQDKGIALISGHVKAAEPPTEGDFWQSIKHAAGVDKP